MVKSEIYNLLIVILLLIVVIIAIYLLITNKKNTDQNVNLLNKFDKLQKEQEKQNKTMQKLRTKNSPNDDSKQMLTRKKTNPNTNSNFDHKNNLNDLNDSNNLNDPNNSTTDLNISVIEYDKITPILPELIKIWKEAFTNEQNWNNSLIDLEGRMGLKNGTIFFVATLKDKLVGFCNLMLFDQFDVNGRYMNPMIENIYKRAGEQTPPNEIAFLYNFCVDKMYRGQGFGKKILNSVCEWAQKSNKKNVYLFVNKKNHIAVSIYDKMKFIKIGDDSSEEIVMKKTFQNENSPASLYHSPYDK